MHVLTPHNLGEKMKKIFLVLLSISLSSASFCLAQEDMQGMDAGMQGQGGGMMGGRGKGKMMGMMQNDSLVATSDGGVIIKSGPRLIKYDKDLNLIKEVELPRGKKPESREPEEASADATPQ